MVSFHGIGGHGDNGRVMGCSFKLAYGLRSGKSVHFRHLAIHEDEPIVHAGKGHYSFFAIGDHIDMPTEFLEHFRGDFLIDGIVVSHKNSALSLGLRFSPDCGWLPDCDFGVGRSLGIQ